MPVRWWVTNTLYLVLGCAGACRFDTSPLGTELTPSRIAGRDSTAGASGTGAGTSTTTAAASGTGAAGSGALNPPEGAGAAAPDPFGGAGGDTSGSTSPGGTGAPPPSAGAGGSTAAGNGGSAAGSGSTGGMGSAGDMAAPAMPTTGGLPAITDPALPGAFTVKRTNNVGPLISFTMFEPMELGKDGIQHPIVIWGPGAAASPDIYLQLLQHFASHGLVVISYNSTPQGPELTRAIDWITQQAATQSSPYFNKLDVTKIAMGGQSAGSLATFAAANEPRLTTTLHINGGTYNRDAAKNLIKPAFFICGDDPATTGGDGTWESDAARPNCEADFMTATVPVWYGVVIGSSHTTVIDNPLNMSMSPLKVYYLASSVAWLRWQLAGDLTMKALFVGPDCGYCKQPMVWEVKQKDLM